MLYLSHALIPALKLASFPVAADAKPFRSAFVVETGLFLK